MNILQVILEDFFLKKEELLYNTILTRILSKKPIFIILVPIQQVHFLLLQEKLTFLYLIKIILKNLFLQK